MKILVVASPESVIALIIRHPFQWYYQFGHGERHHHRKDAHVGLVRAPPRERHGKHAIDLICFLPGDELCAQLWLDIFGRTLSDLAGASTGGSSRIWAMIRFEALLTSPQRTLREALLALGLDADKYPYASIAYSQSSSHRRRSLLGYRASNTADSEIIKVDKQYLWHTKDLAPKQSRRVDNCHAQSNSEVTACCQFVTLVKALFGYDLVTFDQSNVTEAVPFSSRPAHKLKLNDAVSALDQAGFSDEHFQFSTSRAHASCFSKIG